MNSFQQWASGYARAFGFDVTPCANWVQLHRDGATVECMGAKAVQLACFGPGARIKVFSLVTDSDAGTEVEVFGTEAERDARCAMICAAAWSDAGKTEPCPSNWRDAWETLSETADWWLVVQDHELPLLEVFA